MSDTRKPSTQDKIDTVRITADALSPHRVTGKDVADTIARQVELVHPKSGTQSAD